MTGGCVVSAIIHIVDDDASFRNAMSRMLRVAGYEVESYEDGQQLLDKLPDDSAPGCILLDLKIPRVSGVDLQDRLIALGSTIPIIFLTGHGDIPVSVQAIKAGAEDFLTKPVPRTVLIDTIERALARQRETLAQQTELKAIRALFDKLTPREREVFDLVVRGQMNKQIAHVLGTTERTIKAHRHRVMEKVQVRSLAELVNLAVMLKLTGPAGHRKH
jgi:RNA polymerase sigma factor (sigma-70 family)